MHEVEGISYGKKYDMPHTVGGEVVRIVLRSL